MTQVTFIGYLNPMSLLLSLLLVGGMLRTLAADQYDVVIRGGTVVDPDSGLQDVRDVGIRGGTIVAVSREALTGDKIIDAGGLIVAPGFIDLHAHGQDLDNSRFQVMDGVTTACEMEIGVPDAPLMLRMVDAAAKRGMDVTTECYPYGAGMTEISSAIFDGDWKNGFGIDYGDLQWVATGERLTAETFAARRQETGMVIMHMNPPGLVEQIVLHPTTMIASDGVLRDRKGRVQVGADADIVVFDLETIHDIATYSEPAQFSDGMRYVLVGGVAVVENGQLKDDRRVGKGLRGPIGARN